MHDVILRYFGCLGRAQPLRHALADAEVPFEDVRASVAEWSKRKSDPAFGGPFGGLPTLTFGGALVAETLPIATFLGRRLGHYDGLDDAKAASIEAITSNCYIEVLLRAGELIWADLMYPGADLGRAYPGLLGRMLEKLGAQEACSPDAGWLVGDKPTMADFFVGESVEVVRYLLGRAREDALRARFPRLTSLEDRIQSRPAIARLAPRRCATFTARPDEPAIVERVRAQDLSSAGFAVGPPHAS